MTLVPVSSTWIVEGGNVYADGEQVRSRGGGYHCSTCGQSGHSERTCGLSDEQRAARRIAIRRAAAKRAAIKRRIARQMTAVSDARQEIRERIAARFAK